jgi:hypothetical protein
VHAATIPVASVCKLLDKSRPPRLREGAVNAPVDTPPLTDKLERVGVARKLFQLESQLSSLVVLLWMFVSFVWSRIPRFAPASVTDPLKMLSPLHVFVPLSDPFRAIWFVTVSEKDASLFRASLISARVSRRVGADPIKLLIWLSN